MQADTPERVIELFSAAMSDGDVDAAIDLYEVEATFLARPGECVTGRDAICDALERFAALNPRLQGEITKVSTASDVALVRNRWRLEGTQSDGSSIELRGHSTDVVRRDERGTWRILIDDPWGSS